MVHIRELREFQTLPCRTTPVSVHTRLTTNLLAPKQEETTFAAAPPASVLH
jgi:hypothetical protein